MPLDAAIVDQIVVVGRTSTWDFTWDQELRHSLRTDPKDLTLQVKLLPDGCWHRKAIGGKRTACGHLLGGYAARDERYTGELCADGCFSPYELHELTRLVAVDDPAPIDD